MGKKSAPTPPPAPDPTVVAQAQADANIKTAQEQQKLNMINTYGPQGSSVYAVDPTAPGGYSQTTTLSPSQQAIYDQGTQAQSGALGIANDQLGRVSSALGQGLNPNNVQTWFSMAGPVQRSFDQGGQLQSSFDPGQSVQGHIGPQDLYGAYQTAANASYAQAASRLDPQWGLQEQQLRAHLANQGLSEDSDAYKNALDQFQRQKTDAYNQAAYSSQNQGLTAENTLFGQSATQGQFANQAAAQEYAQNQGQAAFNNQTAGQQYQQNLGAAEFGNAAQQQRFQENQAEATFQNQAANQAFQQQAYAQELPINEFNALMSSNQVGMPTGVQYTPSQVNPTDVLGAYALNTQAQQAAYNAQMQNQSSNLGGLFKLGASILTAPMTGGGSLVGNFLSSDIRLKTDVRRIGTLDNGVPLYSYRYRTGGPRQIGVMAHELATVRPDLVREFNGFLAVDYGGL